MKDIFLFRSFFHIAFCLIWQITGTGTIFAGSWCPYQVEKMVPCRVKNGTEPYYGPNICWKSINGSFACTKKILHRPKFVTTYKRMVETKYKCCPGLEGSDCQDECFNCTTFHEMANRVTKMEMKLDQFIQDEEKDDEENKENDLLASQIFLDQDILHRNLLHDGGGGGDHRDDKPLTYIALNTRISSLLNEFRDMETRVQTLESEVYRLSASLEDRDRVKNRIHQEQQQQHHNSREVTLQPSSLRQQGSPIISSSSSSTTTKSLESNSGTLHSSKELRSVQKYPVIVTSSRKLEENLERGDIASTINDDYGEEQLFENSTEQYLDPLHREY